MTRTTEAADALTLTKREEWRAWLSANHAHSKGVWLIYYKKHTGRPTIPYEHAVEEALCYGWIDGKVQRIDEDRYRQMFTPRKPKSIWSEHNKRRARDLEARGLMTEAGRAKIRAAKENGMWDESSPVYDDKNPPRELVAALSGNSRAREFYESLAPTYKKQYHWWIVSAKRPETREKRLRKAVQLLEEHKKLGM